jgi:hypothetical protein
VLQVGVARRYFEQMYEVISILRGTRWLVALLAVVAGVLSRADCFEREQRLPPVLRLPNEPAAFSGGTSVPAWHISWQMARSRSKWTVERAADHPAIGCFGLFWESRADTQEFSVGRVVPERVMFTTELQRKFPFIGRDTLYRIIDLDLPVAEPYWPGAWMPIDSQEAGAVWTRGLGGYALRLRFEDDNGVGVAYWFADGGESPSRGVPVVAERFECSR